MPTNPDADPAADALLHTRRLSLRPMRVDDLDFVTQMLGDADVMRFYPQVYDRAGAEKWLERMILCQQRDGHSLWLVCDRASGSPRGQVGILKQEVEGRSLTEVGYLIHRPFWRQGLATEAATACRDWAFQTLTIPRLHALIRPVNCPSQGVARKLGMRPEERTVQFHDLEHYLFGMSRADWQAGR